MHAAESQDTSFSSWPKLQCSRREKFPRFLWGMRQRHVWNYRAGRGERIFVRGRKRGDSWLDPNALNQTGDFFSGKYLAEIRRKEFPPRGKGPEK